MKRFWFIWMAFIVATISVQGQEVSAILDHDQIKIGEQTTIQLELRCPASVQSIMLPQLQDTISKFVEVLDVSTIDTTFDEEDITTKIFTQTITITSWDSGFHAIPPFLFIVGADTIKTKALLLTVNTIPIKAEQDIKDIKNIIEVPFSLLDWILTNKISLGLGALIIVLIIIGVILYRRYKNQPQVEQEVFVPKEAADIVAKRKLEELESKQLWQKDKIKHYYSELSFISREYIENRFQLRALELTTDEIITLLTHSSEVSKDDKERLQSMLFLADMAKFAKQRPIASENEQAFKTAFIFIENTAIKKTLNPEEKQLSVKQNTNKTEKIGGKSA